MRILLKSILLTFFVCFSQTHTHAIISYHAPTAAPSKSLKQPKKVKFLTLLRELKNYNPNPRTKAEKIILYAFLIVSIVAFIYFLQGSIWLSIIGLITFLGIKAGKKQRERPEIVYLNEKGEEVLPTQSYKKSKIVDGKSYANRSVKSFLWGLGLLVMSILFLFASASLGFGFVFLFTFIASVISLFNAVGRAIKSISNKEPDKDKATLILVLSLLLLLSLAFFILFFILSING